MGKLEIKDILGLAKPATKLIEIVSGAIGTVYEPRKIRKIADAEAYRLKKISDEANKSNFRGDIEFSESKIIINNKKIDNNEIKNLVINEVDRLLNEKENIKKIADIAYNELENDKNEIKEEIDDDWKNNFFDKGRKIYSEDLQFIFGKILAGEIKSPGSFSKRLLNILSNLSQKEAILFNKLSNYVLKSGSNSFIISDSEILEDLGITLDEIILLEEVGLVNSHNLTISGNNTYEYKNYLIRFMNEPPKLNMYVLTLSGCELEKIISNEISLKYLSKIKQQYNISKMDYSVILSREEQEDGILYSLENTKDID